MKRGERVFTDFQSTCSFWDKVGHRLPSMAVDGLYSQIEEWKDGTLYDAADVNPMEGDEITFPLHSFNIRGGDYRDIPYFAKQVWNMQSKARNKLGACRIPMPDAVRVYAVIHPTLPEGQVLIEGPNMWLSRIDGPEILLKHDGADQDDAFVVKPLGNNKVEIYRNPNQIDEISTLNVSSQSELFFS